MDELKSLKSDLVQLARLALAENPDDVRLFVARLIRRYRGEMPELAEKFDHLLKQRGHRSAAFRKTEIKRDSRKNREFHSAFPVDDETRLSLLRRYESETHAVSPMLTDETMEILHRLVDERKHIKILEKAGLTPTRSAVFVGKPGVGKSLTAQWVASQLGLPLFILDLTAVMSSLLGKSGSNLRSALDFAKRQPCVLLLDEFDAIAKRRSDETDIGELKRLVTVILQEVENWPPDGLLLAATNHPELVDPAIWRRFDIIIEFELPKRTQIAQSLTRFLAKNVSDFSKWLDVLVLAFNGDSYSDIEREVSRLRRALTMKVASPQELVEEFISMKSVNLNREERIELAAKLASTSTLTQHAIKKITGVSRDTIRKYSKV